jgi:hypothetical protein
VSVNATKMCEGTRTRTEGVLLDLHVFQSSSSSPCILNHTLSLRKRASRTVKVFARFMVSSVVVRD